MKFENAPISYPTDRIWMKKRTSKSVLFRNLKPSIFERCLMRNRLFEPFTKLPKQHTKKIPKINKKYISGICNYGINFPASIEFQNIYGTQFHPEKSQKYGLQIIKNFLKISLK